MQRIRQIINRGQKVVFPDVQRLEKLMLTELQIEKGVQKTEDGCQHT